jgi:hypothetical protein
MASEERVIQYLFLFHSEKANGCCFRSRLRGLCLWVLLCTDAADIHSSQTVGCSLRYPGAWMLTVPSSGIVGFVRSFGKYVSLSAKDLQCRAETQATATRRANDSESKIETRCLIKANDLD